MEEIVELKVKLENIQLPVVSLSSSAVSRQMSLKRHNSNKLSPAGKYTHRTVGSNESSSNGSSSANSEIPCHQEEKQQQKETTVGTMGVEACDTDGHPAVVVDSSPFKLPRKPMLSNLANSGGAQPTTTKSSSSKLSRSVSRVEHRQQQDYTYDVIECDSQTPMNNQKDNVDDDDDDDRDDGKSKQTSSKVFLNLFLIYVFL